MAGMTTVMTQSGMIRMAEDATIHTEVTKHLLDPGDKDNLPLYAVMVKVTVGAGE